jgi:hypothetical protein
MGRESRPGRAADGRLRKALNERRLLLAIPRYWITHQVARLGIVNRRPYPANCVFPKPTSSGSELAYNSRASVRRHRSHLESSLRRALNWQFMYLATAAWRCGRLKWMPRFAAHEQETFPEGRRGAVGCVVRSDGGWVGLDGGGRPGPFHSPVPQASMGVRYSWLVASTPPRR